MKCYAIENHPNDSRVKIDPDGVVQTLSSRMGTGGNNTPFVLITSTKAGSPSGHHTPSQAYVQKAETAETEVKDLFVTNSSGEGVAAPLDASYFKGQGLRQGIEREYVLLKRNCYGIDSHPEDCRIKMTGNVCSTITVKIAKASSDGPLVLISEKE